ncbi:uncharacterized protein LOC113296531 [Papaver somniferum]|uniref:uncharacterized protein LOC113296531 n=1 Tax=Papaver somniferum TaxID=3469 RepID=UPI000E7019A6|nr:uncharacterized protein LOC113296531 [Papaver somniferum]
MKDIAFHKYTRPTSIQAQAMPVALHGRDLLGYAELGSGKIAAFAIPMIQHCLAQRSVRRGNGRPIALVLAPTGEHARLIGKEVKAFSRSVESFRTATAVGGTNMAEQVFELRAGVSIVVATAGSLIDHLQQGNTRLSRISFVVLDEADRMLDMGFEQQIRKVMRNLPVKHQTLLFSATMSVGIETLAPVEICALSSWIQIFVHPVLRVHIFICPTFNVTDPDICTSFSWFDFTRTMYTEIRICLILDKYYNFNFISKSLQWYAALSTNELEATTSGAVPSWVL